MPIFNDILRVPRTQTICRNRDIVEKYAENPVVFCRFEIMKKYREQMPFHGLDTVLPFSTEGEVRYALFPNNFDEKWYDVVAVNTTLVKTQESPGTVSTVLVEHNDEGALFFGRSRYRFQFINGKAQAAKYEPVFLPDARWSIYDDHPAGMGMPMDSSAKGIFSLNDARQRLLAERKEGKRPLPFIMDQNDICFALLPSPMQVSVSTFLTIRGLVKNRFPLDELPKAVRKNICEFVTDEIPAFAANAIDRARAKSSKI